MSRLIFVPQYPQPMRYQEWWITEFEKEFKKQYDEVIVLGKWYLDQTRRIQNNLGGMFASVKDSISFEQLQISEYINLELRDDDTLFISDISFPGFFANVLYHKRPRYCFAYCHATSLNRFDYFSKDRKIKFRNETSHSELFNQIFIGSRYHRRKLWGKLNKWRNVTVIGVPKSPFKTYRSDKKYDLISVNRPTVQKCTKKIEREIEKDFGKIERQTFSSWEKYYQFLSEGKILILTVKEETFGYSALEANMNGTIVLAPNNFSYPELFSREYLYDNLSELKTKIWQNLNEVEDIPDMLNNEMIDNFYNNLIGNMKSWMPR